MVVDAEDTDVYIQAAAISYNIPGIICMKKKKEFFFCRAMCSDEDIAKCLNVMTAVMPIAAFMVMAKLYFMRKWQRVLKPVTSLGKPSIE